MCVSQVVIPLKCVCRGVLNASYKHFLQIFRLTAQVFKYWHSDISLIYIQAHVFLRESISGWVNIKFQC